MRTLIRQPRPRAHLPASLERDLAANKGGWQQKRLGVRIGKDYPAPLVDLNATRQHALAGDGEARKKGMPELRAGALPATRGARQLLVILSPRTRRLLDRPCAPSGASYTSGALFPFHEDEDQP